MWLAMMAVMMSPTAWPWVRAFQRFGGSSSTAMATVLFAIGYLVTWSGYAIAAAALQRLLHGVAITAAGAFIFAVAGVYQFVPLKRACLAHCRNPLTYFLARWRNGPASGLQMGINHGLYCVGCCWALMATALAVGAMNVWWMAVLAATSFAEQVAPHGEALRRPLGAALLAAAVWRLI